MIAPPDTQVPPRSANATVRSRRRTQQKESFYLLLPALIPVVILSVVPIAIGVFTAFTNSQLLQLDPAQFVGLRNFATVLKDAAFWDSFRIGVIWTVSVTVLQVVLGLCLALLLNSDLRFRGVVRVLAIVPWAMPPVVVAIMWQAIYRTNGGPLNWLVDSLGGPQNIDWLGNASIALPAVILVGVWVGIPQNTIMSLAGLQQISPELVEAAKLDGAGAWNRFLHVTLPALRPVLISVASLSAIWNFNSFGIVYVLTGGGPGGKTLLPMLFVYIEAFQNGDTGIAAAMTDIILIVLAAIVAIGALTRLRKAKA